MAKELNNKEVTKLITDNVCYVCGEPATSCTREKIRIDDPIYNPKPCKEYKAGLITYYCDKHNPRRKENES